MRPAFGPVVLLGFACIAVSISLARAQYPEPVWGAEEIVDTGSIELTSSSGAGILYTTEWAPWGPRHEWHIVYAKAGEIYHAVRTSAGWQAPDQLTADEAVSGNPKLAFARDKLIVVWEDDRRGHPEIWVREYDGSSWGTEIGLADDETPSQAPVIVGWQGEGYVAWQEGPDGQSGIVGRGYTSLGWGTVETISAGAASAIEPSIGYCDWVSTMLVAWADARHGDYEIYTNLREGGTWQGDTRFTDLEGSSRRPGVDSENCCGDVIAFMSLIAFENDATGVPEVWIGYVNPGYQALVGRISAADGRASQHPQVHGYSMLFMGGMGGYLPRFPVTWTEEGDPGGRTHLLGMVNSGLTTIWVDSLTTAGQSTSGVAAKEGSPKATLMTAWLEDRDGESALIARPGEAVGCDGLEFTGPPRILLTPGGTRGNPIFSEDTCPGGGPAEGIPVNLQFESSLAPLLTWDVQQPHPVTQADTTDANGEANLTVRGGGCSATGRVNLRANGVLVQRWIGAVSPDVDGDCWVQVDDLAYVTSKLGTSDFCADLDGSGSVTQFDVGIVEEALGSCCSQLVAVEEPTVLGALNTGAPIRVTPNPSSGSVEIRIQAGRFPRGPIRVFDAAGRLVRSVGLAPTGQGMTTIRWDGRNEAGQLVPPGLYYIRAGRQGAFGRHPVVIVR